MGRGTQRPPPPPITPQPPKLGDPLCRPPPTEAKQSGAVGSPPPDPSAAHPEPRIPPGYLGRGCLQCRFTRKPRSGPSPSLLGWRGPWARGNHSAGGLAPFSSAPGWQVTELPSAEQAQRPPRVSPSAPQRPGSPAQGTMGLSTRGGTSCEGLGVGAWICTDPCCSCSSHDAGGRGPLVQSQPPGTVLCATALREALPAPSLPQRTHTHTHTPGSP